MAIRVGVNVQDSVIYRARKLMQRHNEMIKEIEAKDLILRAGELEKKYPGLNRICRDLKKYEICGQKSIRSLCRKKWMTFCMKQN